MKTGKKSTLFLFAFLLFFWLSRAAPVRAQDISEYEKRLAEITKQIETIKKKISEGQRKKSSILSQLSQIGFQKKLLKNEIILNQTKLKKANQELSVLEKKIPSIQKKLEEEKQAVEKILVALYKLGKIDYFELMLKVNDAAGFLIENKHLTLIARHQEKKISEYLYTLDELNESLSEAEKKKKEIKALVLSSEQKNQELISQEKRYTSLINRINSNKESYQKTIKELQERSEQLQNLMEKILKNPSSIPVNLIPMYEKKGSLPWPIQGKVISSFGLKRHPKFNTITKNNGIEISPGGNSVVKCIHPGIVVYTDYFQGYGNLIIIDHGMSYYSLYGHCSSFIVSKGDAVNSGQPIAIVGDTSSLSGKSLYFEVRYKTKPLDPLKWLK
ncbi:MAG: peptidoglycan DD-metalloendopeptidase family protein [Candidatus Aminicenantes bacterium]|nr:peptidoglycan DD-metalloendopeptidase family protein [Candidatus Aminicenantes bacterium]